MEAATRRSARQPSIFSLAAVFTPALALCGCAITYVDNRGDTHVLGLTAITIAGIPPGTKEAARSAKVTAIGISIISTDYFSAASVGYGSSEVVAVRNNACVQFGRLLGADGFVHF
jgi:hypothetical protein